MSEHSHVIPNEWLALYYDGELDSRRREQVEAHLPACVLCQQELAALQALSTALAIDRLPENALTTQSARLAWRELEPRLPGRGTSTSSLLRWLPGIGLLMANVFVQFIAAVSLGVMLAAGQLGWIAWPIQWLDRALSGWLFGWITWLLPIQEGGWGLSLFLIIVSAWLAVLYLAWLVYVRLDRPSPAIQPMVRSGSS